MSSFDQVEDTAGDGISSPVAERLGGLAIVVIGRNEGERLARSLDSVRDAAELTVYVDSGSSDRSIELARDRGVVVVELDMSVPFTAARARNAGFREVIRRAPRTTLIQFIDGDCEVVADWLRQGWAFLQANPGFAAVCGRRKERFPERSIYNELCDIEWSVKPGPAKYFGGDVMIRVAALSEVGGYRDGLIAGEEPELCVRLRARGWLIQVLPLTMTLHDADMTRFGQWWQRMKRSGYAYAAGYHLHGGSPERHWAWQTMQAWIWVPAPILLTVVLLFSLGTPALLVLGMYPLQSVRLYLKAKGSKRARLLESISLTLVRFPEFSGQLRYISDLMRRRAGQLIEYK